MNSGSGPRKNRNGTDDGAIRGGFQSIEIGCLINNHILSLTISFPPSCPSIADSPHPQPRTCFVGQLSIGSTTDDISRPVIGRWQISWSCGHFKGFSDGDKKEERRFVSLFIRQNNEALETLRANCVEGESPEWRGGFHRYSSC